MIKYCDNNELKHGENIFSLEEDKKTNMLMDFSVFKMKKNEKLDIKNETKEIAIILYQGKIKFIWEINSIVVERENVFDSGPYVLHIAKNVEVKIEFLEESEIGVQKASNEKEFQSKLYEPQDCTEVVTGEGKLENTSKRIIRDVFNYFNAPYSNMVLGEVITFQGRWSSYPPHSHLQPEIYFYKFSREQGFGAGFVGEDIFKIKNNSALMIKGEVIHPQATAPGYAMYYCWMIRHLEKKPWITRDEDKSHSWLNEENPVIWTEKK